MAPRGGGGGGGGCLFFIYICIENFKILIVTYPTTDFNITWLECCFGEPLSRLYKQSWFVKKHGCHGVGLIFPYLAETSNSKCTNLFGQVSDIGPSWSACYQKLPASMAQLDACLTGDQKVVGLTPSRWATFFRGDWSWNIFYSHTLPSADLRRAVVSLLRKNMHNTGLTV